MASPLIIRQVTEALLEILRADLSPAILPSSAIKAAPPETVATETQVLLLYLYEVTENAQLKNVGPSQVLAPPPPSGAQTAVVRRDPLALDLHYLLIPFSSSATFLDTYDILGNAMRSFHDHGMFTPGDFLVGMSPAEDAKLTFRITLNPLSTPDLLRLWEAVHEPYRLSVAYVVRTVQIESGLTTDTRLVSERKFNVG